MVRHMIVGTAGHVDHGKSALVQALTGQDPDRLPEEKERGLTIDLGFAWCDLPGEEESLRLGFVDVPGHERFVAHMVSGVVGMDLVLFVVAADEGLMPQSYEHLEILRILGVRRGIPVITKCDRADPASVDALVENIQEVIKDTFLLRAPVVRTSAVTGEGIAELKEILGRMALESIEDRAAEERAGGSARLPVDRVFTKPGFGTVVTGTLISGVIGSDSELVIYPGERACRLRAMQSYGQEVEQAVAGQRLALNLAKVSTDEVVRGDVIAAAGGMRPVSYLNVSLELSRYSQREITSGMRVHLLIGTAHVLARLYLFRDDERLAQLRLESPVAAMAGDRFILRFYSPLETIGGGRVLETAERKCRMSDARVLARLQAIERGEEPPAEEKKTETPAPANKELPQELKPCADWLMDIHRQAGTALISVHTLTSGEERFEADKIQRALRLLEKRGQLVRVDEAHDTTPQTAAHVEQLVREHFAKQKELTLSGLRDKLGTNRTSARAFFAYLDRRKITAQTGGAAARTAGRLA